MLGEREGGSGRTMRGWKKALPGGAGLFAAWPAAAAACPACAGRGDFTGPVGWAVAGMLAAPALVALVLGVVAYRLQREP